jgi:diguanylate cyclase (GGDEF)-like protein
MAVYFALPDQGWQDITYDLWTTATALLVLLGVTVNKPERRAPWVTIAAGLGLASLGDWTWSLLDALGQQPFPSVADIFYLGGMALVAAGIWREARRRVPDGDRAAVLDALILAAGFAMLSWLLVMKPIVSAESTPLLETVVALAYPTIDIALLAVTARLVLGAGQRAPCYRLLALAMATYLIADLAFAWIDASTGYTTGQWLDAGWLLGTLFFATAALHPSVRHASVELPSAVGNLTWRRVMALTAASLMAPTLLLVEEWQGVEIDALVIATGSIALFLLVIGRLVTVLVDLRETLTERHRLESALRRQATEDPLTGLTNRAEFGERLARAVAIHGAPAGVIFLDLDSFKAVNDSLGHAAGDALLREVAMRLSAVVRSGDTPARLGGDEFAVLLPQQVDAPSALAVARRLVDALAQPIVVDGQELMVTASAGVALGVGGSASADAMMHHADIAMYQAKAAGKGLVVPYAEGTMAGRPTGDAGLRATGPQRGPRPSASGQLAPSGRQGTHERRSAWRRGGRYEPPLEATSACCSSSGPAIVPGMLLHIRSRIPRPSPAARAPDHPVRSVGRQESVNRMRRERPSRAMPGRVRSVTSRTSPPIPPWNARPGIDRHAVRARGSGRVVRVDLASLHG